MQTDCANCNNKIKKNFTNYYQRIQLRGAPLCNHCRHCVDCGGSVCQCTRCKACLECVTNCNCINSSPGNILDHSLLIDISDSDEEIESVNYDLKISTR